MKRNLAAALLALLPLPAALIAQDTTDAASGAALSRAVGLPEIGFLDGFEFEQLSGQATAFFPVGERAAISAMRLRLDLRFDRTIDVRTHLTVRLADRIAHVEPLSAGDGRAEIEIDVPPEAVSGGFLKVGLEYSGANSENICIDERASGDYLRILPTSGLEVDFVPGTLDTLGRVAGAMPRAKRIDAGGDAPASVVLPFVLTASALFDGEYGLVGLADADGGGAGAGSWDALTLALAADETGEGGAVSVAEVAGLPRLDFSGADPDVGVALLGSIWRDLAQGRSAVARVVPPRTRSADVTSFAQLGAPEASQLVTSSATFEFGFSADDFPIGRLPERVELLVGAARSPQDRGVTVSAWLNGSMIGSRPLNENEPVWMDFAIPAGLIGRDNQMAVLVQRQTEAGNCLFAPQGYPAQVLPQSRFILGDAPDPTSDFHLMRQAFAAGADVYAETGADLDELLPWLLPISGAVLPDDVTLTFGGSDPAAGADTDTPFLYIGADAPAGSTPPVRFDRGRVEVSDSAGTLLYDGDGLDDIGIVQIVEIEGRDGIWIRPGAGVPPQPTLETPMLLDRGDIAFVDERGIALAVSANRADLVAVSYPDQVSLMQLFARYRVWIIGAGWLVLTLLIIRFLVGVYRSRRTTGEG